MRTKLSGQKEIKQYEGRSWETIFSWIQHQGYPARKIDGRWESDTELIDEWRRERIRAGEKQ